MRVVLIHNPSAGNGSGAGDLGALLRQAGHEARLLSSTDDGWQAALAAPCDLVAVAGGDGTVAKVAAALPRQDRPPLAILPLGTANNIATALGIVGAPAALVAGWPQAGRRLLDMAQVSCGGAIVPALEGVGLGALAAAMRAVDRTDIDGPGELPAARACLRDLLEHAEAFVPDLRLDGEAATEPVLLVEVMTLDRLGPALRIARQADPGDGWLDVVTLPTTARAAMRAWLADPDGVPAPVTVRRARRVEVGVEGRPFRLGDAFPDAPPPRVTVTPAAVPLTVLV